MSKRISETAFASQVEDLLNIGHWRWMHPRPGRVRRYGRDVYETAYSGHKGWLDYVALRPPRLLVFELKDAYSKMTPEQEEWFNLWEECQKTLLLDAVTLRNGKGVIEMGFARGKTTTLILPEVYLWRPSQIEEVTEILR